MVEALPSPGAPSPARHTCRWLAALLALSACSGDCGEPKARRLPPEPAKPGFPPPVTVFDDFSEAALAPSRWTAKDSLRGFLDPMAAPQLAQVDRRVEDGALRMTSSLTGEISPERGTAVAHFRSTLTEPRGVTALEARLTVHGVTTTQCAANPTFTFTRATIGGLFFNSGEAHGRQLVGDVLAVVGVSRRSDTADPADRLRAVAVVLNCRRPCYAFPVHLPEGRPPSEVVGMKELGPIQVGESTRLGLGWDRDANRFLFWRDGRVAAEVSYPLADDDAPTIERRHLDVAHFVPRCDGGPPAEARLDVSFDDVTIQLHAPGSSPSR